MQKAIPTNNDKELLHDVPDTDETGEPIPNMQSEKVTS